MKAFLSAAAQPVCFVAEETKIHLYVQFFVTRFMGVPLEFFGLTL